MKYLIVWVLSLSVIGKLGMPWWLGLVVVVSLLGWALNDALRDRMNESERSR